ncbi:MAG: hypothetical protein IJ785_03490 [Bacteroidales bacterium]|nr:hypothetical protein [Bacteroidales bacterium]
MKKTNKKMYSQPLVEVLDARVEKGFEGSTTPIDPANGAQIMNNLSDGGDINDANWG